MQISLHNLMQYSLISFIVGVFLDIILGDPHGFPHIVVYIGRLISILEKTLYLFENKRFAGLILVVITVAISGVIPAFILLTTLKLNMIWIYILISSFFNWQLLAMTSLRRESYKVFEALRSSDDLTNARKAISMIVGRDPNALDYQGIIKAAVETVAENTSDGIAAPLFYMMIGGPVLGCIYKSINTMDSMIGYKNDKYNLFGRAAAVLDDIANFLPSRICALAMIIAAGFCGYNMKDAFAIWKRDRFKHSSPNAAQTESVMAGALGVQLAGSAQYFGRLVEKPYIGDKHREIELNDILRSHRIMTITSIILFVIFIVYRGAIYAIF